MREKRLILDYIDDLMATTQCTRLQAFLILRQEHPKMFDALGELLQAETHQEGARA